MTTETFQQATTRLMSERKLSLIDAQIEASRVLDARSRPEPKPEAREFLDLERVQLSDDATSGDAPVWIQLAKSGTFKGHSAGPFTLDDETFSDIVTNFRSQRNGIPIDYEHASEQDATSGSIPTSGSPAVGWITDLKIDRGNLWGLVEWLEPAKSQIRAGQYKFISPAIRFGAKDRVTGKLIGARLTSAGLTNMPFLDGMVPIAAKDSPVVQTGETLSFTAMVRHLMSEEKMSLIDAQIEGSRRLAPKVAA
jgi:phage I-like protein